MTIKELSADTGLSEHQVRGAVAKHGLPTVRLGRRILIQSSRFSDWLAANEKITTAEPKEVLPEYQGSGTSQIAKKMRRIH
jgi:hypothetical protein